MAAKYNVILTKPPISDNYRDGYFPRAFHYKWEALALVAEVQRAGGDARVEPLVKTRKTPKDAFREGEEAVRQRPPRSPRNPYDDVKDEHLHTAWEDGATSAGINDIYTNGVRNKTGD